MNDRLAEYERLVRTWSLRLDLVAPGDLDRFRVRHLDDSLRALEIVDNSTIGPAIDVGSGAGLPGIPLAIARPERLWRLLEPRARRAAFLEEVVRALDLSCEIVRKSASEAAADPGLRAAHAVATARALAPPRDAFELLSPLLKPGGTAIVWIGARAEIPPEAGSSVPGLATMKRKPGSANGRK